MDDADEEPNEQASELSSPDMTAPSALRRGRAHGRRNRRATLTIITGFTLLVLAGALQVLLVLDNNRKTSAVRSGWVIHDAVAHVLGNLVDAETGQRGYLLTGDETYLEPFYKSRQELSGLLTRLRELAAPLQGVVGLVEQVDQSTMADLRLMEEVIALRRVEDWQKIRQLNLNAEGKSRMDVTRRLIGDLESAINADQVVKADALDGVANALMGAVIGALLCVIALAALLIRDTRRHLHLLERREGALRVLSATLERRVSWRTRTLLEMNQRFAAALSASGVTVFTQDRDLVYTWISQADPGTAFAHFLGRSDDDVIPPRSRRLIVDLKRDVIATGQSTRTEISLDIDGTERWYDVALGPQRAVDGAIVGVIGGAVEITERKETAARIWLLMREVTHRSKNLLSVIQAIARQTATTSGSIEDFLRRFGARLHSLAGSHDLLVQEDWRGASIRELVQTQLGHYSDLANPQIRLMGDPLRIHPDAAQHIGMALHELATNAAKYGALSVPEGEVQISWTLTAEGPDGPRCRLTWEERNGPPVQAPKRRGFGHVVIERTVARALGGTVRLVHAPEGVQWTLDFPGSYIVHNGTSST
ncbi:sensor histidine kinase [Limobrevibacterium gyesilva]|uniref:histidine kinase n=1 Tax=Limobrevibacterium gyesilva TaxID=2991712 RepID=A0AA41YP56_9PROT|nr:CHASE3 domain-containing protein [Limobrevibacterium gyesilva]MCW3477144.1 CHASE3 domain-containing protein [Limobrevibacterium gyesilva]